MPGTTRVDVKNLTDGPKIFNGMPPRTILAGQSAQDIDVSASELESMKSSGWFEISGDTPARGKAEPHKNAKG
jgi:hypothetical protein